MNCRFLLLCLTILTSALLQAQTISPIKVENTGFDADYFSADSDDRYGVIVLTGSGGGKANYTAEKIAAMGYHVLSLAYFDKNGSSIVPSTLEEIPLEYFTTPKEWLMNRNDTRSDGVIVYGLSKGAELALCLAAHDNDYKAVVALAPSHVVWQGVPENMSDNMSPPSSWSWKGKGLPFVPYVSLEEKERLGFSNRHEASLTNTIAVERARIKVENTNGPILLLSGGMDENWPAAEMATEICSRANANSASSCTHITYAQGDHLLSNYQSESFGEVATFLHSVNE